MKVLIIKPTGHIRMDSDVYIDALKSIGVEVVTGIIEKDNISIDGSLTNINLIWCPYEQEIPFGVILKNKLNIPLVGHYEWIPPWRISNNDIWGYNKEDIELGFNTKEECKKYYSYLINNFNKCDVKTVPSKYCLETIEAVAPINKKKLFYKPYIIDDTLLLKSKNILLNKKNQILTIGRLVKHKKIDHIIKALSKINNAPKLIIIGYGNEMKNIIKLAEDLNVKIEFVGLGQEGNKAKYIQESLFLVTPCASLPLGEAALFKVPTIMYDFDNMIEKHGIMGKYVVKNDINALTSAIQFWLDNPEKAIKEGEKSYNNLINGECGLSVSNICANRMVEIFKEAL